MENWHAGPTSTAYLTVHPNDKDLPYAWLSRTTNILHFHIFVRRHLFPWKFDLSARMAWRAYFQSLSWGFAPSARQILFPSFSYFAYFLLLPFSFTNISAILCPIFHLPPHFHTCHTCMQVFVGFRRPGGLSPHETEQEHDPLFQTKDMEVDKEQLLDCGPVRWCACVGLVSWGRRGWCVSTALAQLFWRVGFFVFVWVCSLNRTLGISLRLWWRTVFSVEWCMGLALVVWCCVVSCELGPVLTLFLANKRCSSYS
jgi:hypothetical protein